MRGFAALALLLAAVAPAAAGEGASGRFTFVPAENGVFRLDTETGAVTLCIERGGSLVCMRAPDSLPTAAAAREAERLQALSERVTALEDEPRRESGPARDGEAVGRVKVLAERAFARLTTLVRAMRGEAL